MNLFWRYGHKIKKWDDRLVMRSVIFGFMAVTVAGVVVMLQTDMYWSAIIRISGVKIINGLFFLLLWDIAAVLLMVFLKKKIS